MESDDGRTVLFNGHEIHPDTQREGGQQYHPDAKHSDFILIHARVPIYNEQLHALAANDVEVVRSIDQQTCLCRYKPKDLEVIRAFSWVVYANVYHSDLVVSADLQEQLQAAGEAKSAGSSDNTEYDVNISPHRHPKISTQQLLSDIAAKLKIPATELQSDGDVYIQARLRAEQIHEIAAMDHVRAVQLVKVSGLHNDVANQIIMEAPGVPEEMGEPKTWDGGGQIVAVADNDTGTHGTHIAATVLGQYIDMIPAGPSKSTTSNSNDIEIAWKDNFLVEGMAPAAKLYFQSIGRWYKVKYKTPDGTAAEYRDEFLIKRTFLLTPLFEAAYKADARIHTSSTGFHNYNDVHRQYSDDADALDTFVFKFPDFLVLKSAGNGGDEDLNPLDPETHKFINPVLQPDGRKLAAGMAGATAGKNGITVGMCYSARSQEWENFPKWVDPKYRNSPRNHIDIPMKSVRGPTLQGVIKPDLVAPGMAIYSAASRDPKSVAKFPPYWRKKGDPKATAQEDRIPISVFQSGTSQATPVVAGAAACVRQALVNYQGEEKTDSKRYPTAALIKAILINTATDLNEYVGAVPDEFKPQRKVGAGRNTKWLSEWKGGRIGPAPNGVQGWGRLNLALACKVAEGPGAQWGFFEARDTAPGLPGGALKPKIDPTVNDIRRWSVSVPKLEVGKGWILRVHLVWSDPPGPGLQHDLLLSVVDPHDNRIYSNGTTKGANDAAPSAYDAAKDVTKDTNVKHVVFEDIAEGQVFIEVEAKKILQAQQCAVVWRLEEFNAVPHS